MYLESDLLEFPVTAIEQTSEMRIKLCNNSNEIQLVSSCFYSFPFIDIMQLCNKQSTWDSVISHGWVGQFSDHSVGWEYC